MLFLITIQPKKLKNRRGAPDNNPGISVCSIKKNFDMKVSKNLTCETIDLVLFEQIGLH
jgi:hypothetical protein